MSFELLMNITKKVPSLRRLIAFIGINNLFGVKSYILMDLLMEYGKWGKFLTQKPYLSNQVTKIYIPWPQIFITHSIQNV